MGIPRHHSDIEHKRRGALCTRAEVGRVADKDGATVDAISAAVHAVENLHVVDRNHISKVNLHVLLPTTNRVKDRPIG